MASPFTRTIRGLLLGPIIAMGLWVCAVIAWAVPWLLVLTAYYILAPDSSEWEFLAYCVGIPGGTAAVLAAVFAVLHGCLDGGEAGRQGKPICQTVIMGWPNEADLESALGEPLALWPTLGGMMTVLFLGTIWWGLVGGLVSLGVTAAGLLKYSDDFSRDFSIAELLLVALAGAVVTSLIGACCGWLQAKKAARQGRPVVSQTLRETVAVMKQVATFKFWKG